MKSEQLYILAMIFGLAGFFGLVRFLVFQNGTPVTNSMMLLLIPAAVIIAREELKR